jgi:hypothetical protein
LIAIFNGDFNASFGGEVKGIALPADGALFLLLRLLFDDGGEDAVHRAATGIISGAQVGGVAFDLFGDLGAACLAGASVAFAVGFLG